MKARHILLAGVLSIALGALASCSDPVYATLETATKTVTNTLPLLLSVIDIAVTSTGSTYSVAAGAVFAGSLSSPVGGTMNWTPTNTDPSRPFNPSGLQCFGGMALFTYPPGTTRLFGGFFDTSGNPSLYRSDASLSFNSVSATRLPTAVPGEQVTFLQSTPGTLFMGGAVLNASSSPQQYQYQLDSSTDGQTFTPTNLTALPDLITGVGFDGSNYWAASGSTLYKSAAASFAGYTTLAITGDEIRGLFVDPGTPPGRIFVTTKTQGIFYSLDGGSTWRHLTDDPSGSSSNYPAGFLCVAGPVDNGNRFYLVGSDGYGYYTLDTLANTWTRFGDSTILLYTSSVRRIVVDKASQENVLMGTNLNGLWRAVFDPVAGTVLNGTNQYWIHE